MKTLSIIFAVLLSTGFAVKADFKFDETDYKLGWEAETNHTIIKEFFSANQTTNNWTTMITFQSHPGATKIKEVSGPYGRSHQQFGSRRQMLLFRFGPPTKK